MDDVVLLSRLQFALTIMFHYLFPPLTIGMGAVLVWLEGNHLLTKDPIYDAAARFWTKIFALNFAVGVATGIVMEFEFGTNWATYSRFVGDVFGSALAAEGIFAFFLESGFLAVLVFGWDRVGPRMHFFATCMVALGSIFSSVWITVANSWQQTPAGHEIVQIVRDGRPWFVDGQPMMRAEIQDFWAMVLNPSSLHRLIHVWIGCFIMGAFFILSISAWYLLKERHVEFAKRSFTGALVVATVASLASAVSGHFQAHEVYANQPAKLAAFEGHYRTGPADLNLFGVPDTDARRVRAAVVIPGGLSWLLFGDPDVEVLGLDRFRPADRPPVAIPFASYHVMVALGFGFIGLTSLASFLRWRGTLWRRRGLLWVFVFAVVGAVVANQVGWVAAEVGRQPWIVHPPIERDEDGRAVLDDDGYVVYGTVEATLADGTVTERVAGLRTVDGISKVVEAEQVLASIVLFGGIYLLLGALWIFVLHRKIRHGPEPPAPPGSGGTAQGWVEAAGSVVGHERSLTGDRDSTRGGGS